jgi:hypothetical protein
LSETYEKYARDSYTVVMGAMRERLLANGGKPLLVVSGESHEDGTAEKWSNAFTRDSKEQPALAAAYTHMAAITAAVRLVGKENVVVSIEQYSREMGEIARDLRMGLKPKVQLNDEKPMSRAILYANSLGLKIQGTDEGRVGAIRRAEGDLNKAIDDNSRYVEERQALNDLGRFGPRPPKIVVHIGGAAHIQMLHGYGPTDNVAQMSANVRNAVKNPFEAVYGRPLFFNSSDINSDGDVTHAFTSNARNAIQRVAPGAMDANDIKNIEERIKAADRAFVLPGDAPGAARTPTITVPGLK